MSLVTSLQPVGSVATALSALDLGTASVTSLGTLDTALSGSFLSTVTTINTGLMGPPGIGASFEHTQGPAATPWVINHNLGRKVAVELYTPGGMEMLGDIVHVSLNQVQISFASPTSGSALIQ